MSRGLNRHLTVVHACCSFKKKVIASYLVSNVYLVRQGEGGECGNTLCPLDAHEKEARR